MTYTFTCNQGHEPVSFTAEAETDEEAVQKIMEQTASHLKEVHSNMPPMSEEEAKNMIMSSWAKS